MARHPTLAFAARTAQWRSNFGGGFGYMPGRDRPFHGWHDDLALCHNVPGCCRADHRGQSDWLEDWQAEGVAFIDVDEILKVEQPTTFEGIKQYEQKFYYAGQWKPEYDRWVEMAAGLWTGPGADVVTKVQARVFEMIFFNPVLHEFERIKAPTTLMIGQLHRTAVSGSRAPPDVAKRFGNYPELGRSAAKRIPNAKLIEFPDLGTPRRFRHPTNFTRRC